MSLQATPQQIVGRIIRSLRNEQNWTQEMLASQLEACYYRLEGVERRFDQSYVKNLEKGKIKQLTVNVISAVAEAFSLTTIERKELFLAVAGGEIADKSIPPEEIYSSLMSYLDQTQTPAFVVDSFCDVVAANYSILRFLGIPNNFFEEAESTSIIGFNLMNFVCSDQSGYQRLMGSQWEKAIIYNIQFYRYISFRYRGTERFEAHTEQLKRAHPLFLGYLSNRNQADTTAMNSEHYSYDHPEYGLVEYYGIVAPFFTTVGELYLIVYIPLSLTTTQIFSNIRQELELDHQIDQYYQTLANWPPDPSLLK